MPNNSIGGIWLAFVSFLSCGRLSRQQESEKLEEPKQVVKVNATSAIAPMHVSSQAAGLQVSARIHRQSTAPQSSQGTTSMNTAEVDSKVQNSRSTHTTPVRRRDLPAHGATAAVAQAAVTRSIPEAAEPFKSPLSANRAVLAVPSQPISASSAATVVKEAVAIFVLVLIILGLRLRHMAIQVGQAVSSKFTSVKEVNFLASSFIRMPWASGLSWDLLVRYYQKLASHSLKAFCLLFHIHMKIWAHVLCAALWGAAIIMISDATTFTSVITVFVATSGMANSLIASAAYAVLIKIMSGAVHAWLRLCNSSIALAGNLKQLACSPKTCALAADCWATAKLRFQTVQQLSVQWSAQAYWFVRDLASQTANFHLPVVFFTAGLPATLAIDWIMEVILSSWNTHLIMIALMVWLSKDKLEHFCSEMIAECGNEAVSDHVSELSNQVGAADRKKDASQQHLDKSAASRPATPVKVPVAGQESPNSALSQKTSTGITDQSHNGPIRMEDDVGSTSYAAVHAASAYGAPASSSRATDMPVAHHTRAIGAHSLFVVPTAADMPVPEHIGLRTAPSPATFPEADAARSSSSQSQAANGNSNVRNAERSSEDIDAALLELGYLPGQSQTAYDEEYDEYVTDEPSQVYEPRQENALDRFYAKMKRASTANLSSVFPMTTKHMASGFMESCMRKKLGLAEAEEVEWTYEPAEFSPLVRKLVTVGDQTLGSGVNGAVYYGELLMADDTVKPCAIKSVAFQTCKEMECAHAEAEALEAALGKANLVQCLGAVQHMDSNFHFSLIIITEYIPGEDLDKAMSRLRAKLDKQPDGLEKAFWCGRAVAKEALIAVQGLHAQGRAHCDIKPQNIRVLLDDDGNVLQLTVHDLGGSVVFNGPFQDIPTNFSHSMDFTAPEICYIKAEHDGHPGTGLIDAMAHDIWGLGYLLFWLLTCQGYFSGGSDDWEALCEKQDAWATAHEEEQHRPNSHEILWHLHQYTLCEEEYDMLVDIVCRMLHPNASLRASADEVLQDMLFC